MKILFWVVMFAAYAGQLADWYTTKLGLAAGNAESNPVAAFLIRHLGLKIMLAYKMLWPSLTLGAAFYYHDYQAYGAYPAGVYPGVGHHVAGFNHQLVIWVVVGLVVAVAGGVPAYLNYRKLK